MVSSNVDPVEAVKHKDKRTNIPTRELRGFVEADENQPKTILYPRDPSLDPQLVWKGKDEQDRTDLAVPVVPIYIQEKIHPQAIIEEGASIGRGTRVWAFAHIVAGAVIGEECNICDHTFIEGAVRTGNRVTIKSGVYLWDGVVVEDDVFHRAGRSLYE